MCTLLPATRRGTSSDNRQPSTQSHNASQQLALRNQDPLEWTSCEHQASRQRGYCVAQRLHDMRSNANTQRRQRADGEGHARKW